MGISTLGMSMAGTSKPDVSAMAPRLSAISFVAAAASAAPPDRPVIQFITALPAFAIQPIIVPITLAMVLSICPVTLSMGAIACSSGAISDSSCATGGKIA